MVQGIRINRIVDHLVDHRLVDVDYNDNNKIDKNK